MNRKKALQSIAMGTVSAIGLPSVSHAFALLPDDLKGNINHSACRWCYQDIPLEQLVISGKAMGLKSIDLLGPDEWAVAIKHGLTSAMGYASDLGLNKGFNDPSIHDKLLKDYTKNIPKAAEAGLKKCDLL